MFSNHNKKIDRRKNKETNLKLYWENSRFIKCPNDIYVVSLSIQQTSQNESQHILFYFSGWT